MSIAELKTYKGHGRDMTPRGSGLASRHATRREPARSGSREFRFYVSKSTEINRRYAGKHVAIVGDHVVASGKSPLEVYNRAKKLHPQSRPMLAYVPKGETLVLTVG